MGSELIHFLDFGILACLRRFLGIPMKGSQGGTEERKKSNKSLSQELEPKYHMQQTNAQTRMIGRPRRPGNKPNINIHVCDTDLCLGCFLFLVFDLFFHELERQKPFCLFLGRPVHHGGSRLYTVQGTRCSYFGVVLILGLLFILSRLWSPLSLRISLLSTATMLLHRCFD